MLKGENIITCKELKNLIDAKAPVILLDVREESEYQKGHIDEARLMPLSCFEEMVFSLNVDQSYIVYCKRGGRSERATLFMLEHGYKKVKNMLGGATQWAEEIDPAMRVE